MTSTLLDVIRERIRKDGPMDIGTYMGLCLAHPQFGYYMTRDPFGRGGDFITAPEVSQLFGEMIGAWIADTWHKLGAPEDFILLECGPGRGTLMEDALRATRRVAGFHAAKRLFLMEISPVLKTEQARRLGAYDPLWIATLDDLPSSLPVIIIGNEFLDALPIRQLERRNSVWHERVVDLDEGGALRMALRRPDFPQVVNLPNRIATSSNDGVFETSPELNRFIKFVNTTLRKQEGAALFLDYGHAQSAMGETLQAMRAHRFVNIFDTPGACDLTAHVDFENISKIAREDAIAVSGPVTQGDFLRSLGIEYRAEMLCTKTTPEQAATIRTALTRLIDTSQMGSLFKVSALCHDTAIQLAGFHETV